MIFLAPLSPDMQGGIGRLQLNLTHDRMRANQHARFRHGRGVMVHLVGLCKDPDFGGCMIGNIVSRADRDQVKPLDLIRMPAKTTF